jgi:hypothetical protein
MCVYATSSSRVRRVTKSDCEKMLKFSITPDSMLSNAETKALEGLMPPYLRSMLKDFYLHNAQRKTEEQVFFLLQNGKKRNRQAPKQSHRIPKKRKTPLYPNRSLRPCLFVIQSFRREMSKGNLRDPLCERR